MGARRRLLISAVLAVVMVLPACNRGKGKTYDSPQAVFDAMVAASAKEDWPGMMNCLTDESQDKLTFAVAFMGSLMKQFAGFDKDKGAEAAKAIDEAFKKHGMSEAQLAHLGKDMSPDIQSMRKVIEPIKDKPGFVADVLGALKKLGNKEGTPQQFSGTLTDLKVNGDKATGTVVRNVAGKETKEPVEFKKVGSGWKIEMPDKGMGPVGPK
jgi:hypothetical protein